MIQFINFEKSEALNFHYALLIFLLIPSMIYIIKTKAKFNIFKIHNRKNIGFKKLVKNGVVWSIVFLLISVFIITIFPTTDSSKINREKTILFYGQNMLGDWRIPDYTKFGEGATGMFGLLPYYMNNSGYNTEIVVKNKTKFMEQNFPKNISQTYNNASANYKTGMNNISIRPVNFSSYCKIIESEEVTSDLLKNVDIFVVINLKKYFPDKEKKAIWDFVEQGGSLLVLGDHTDVGNTQKSLNNLLNPTGIRYRFDSALSMDKNFNWGPCYQLMHNPVSHKIKHLNQIQIGVGASLDVSLDSFPMIIERYGLSDKGNYDNENANLGDYKYQTHEQLGDIILAAGAYHGDGKVMAFGDTSGFQNLALPHSNPTVKAVFSWLDDTESRNMRFTQISASLILLLFSALLYFKFKTQKINFVVFPLVICIAIFLSTGFNAMMIQETPTHGDIVYIDTSHNERLNIEPHKDQSLSGMMTNLIRDDYLPLILNDFSPDKIKKSEMLILNAPTRKITDQEVKFLKNYMKNGGLVLLATGYEDKTASIPLLKEFDLDIYDFPLGPVPYTEEQPELFQNQTRFVDSWAIDRGDDKNTETLVAWPSDLTERYDLVTFTKHGSGGLILIGDSQFLYDKNIESMETLWPGNIQFLKNLLDEMERRGVLK
ncbi:MAG: hypothetical protein V5A64_05895 [Candidatus Thermoplasmatota archaeon]